MGKSWIPAFVHCCCGESAGSLCGGCLVHEARVGAACGHVPHQKSVGAGLLKNADTRQATRGTHIRGPRERPSLYGLWGIKRNACRPAEGEPGEVRSTSCKRRIRLPPIAGCGLPHPATRRPGGVRQLLRSGSSVPPRAVQTRPPACAEPKQQSTRGASGVMMKRTQALRACAILRR
jgi:hypothetical protein